jgi:hypothetical protein
MKARSAVGQSRHCDRALTNVSFGSRMADVVRRIGQALLRHIPRPAILA